MAALYSIFSNAIGQRAIYCANASKVDPFFVLDLSIHEKPTLLGLLKIPGYSDYLHPYDGNHIIGIGKNTVTAGVADANFEWYQGIKLAIFDVTDATNPIVLHETSIGQRGTESEALHNHKAFLFDKAKNLLVFFITLAEFTTPPTYDSQMGTPVFQGAFVYDITLDKGFQLRGQITHNDTTTDMSYYYGSKSMIRRSLYIQDTPYTFSNSRLQTNDLNTLAPINKLDF